MKFYLNTKQAELLSSFFFDLAKGATLAAFGFSTAISGIDISTRILNLTTGILVAYFCVTIGLDLIKDKK